MKKSILIIIVMRAGITAYSQTIDSAYKVGTWLGFRTAAVSFTFDDNCPNQLAIVVPMFNEFDFKLTLFTITGTEDGWWSNANWTGLQEAAAQGHEIASHTVTHPRLNELTLELQQYELADSYDTVQWNGKDRNGKQVTSGIYFYQLSSDEFYDSKRMILLR